MLGAGSTEALGFEPGNVCGDLCRLARFGANIADAHSCFIFVPSKLLAQFGCGSSAAGTAPSGQLEIAGYHSLSTDVIERCRLHSDSGLIGWVARHGRMIHVSPFEHDSRTLGMYNTDQQLKSFIGIPVELGQTSDPAQVNFGVLACDSRKSYAFSKLQGKLLENLAAEIANTLHLQLHCRLGSRSSDSWEVFIARAEALEGALGRGSLEVMRARLDNYAELESSIGSAAGIELCEQIYRLIQQGLPPHFPHFRLPNGDIIIALDNMMSSFYQNKIRAIAERVAPADLPLTLEFFTRSFRTKELKSAAVADLVAATSAPDLKSYDCHEESYEYRRA